MTIKDFFDRYHMSIRDFSKECDIPESTLGDILNGTSDIRHCQARTINKLADAFSMTMDDIMSLEPVFPMKMPNPSFGTKHEFSHPGSFQAFRSALLKEVKMKGECKFLCDVLNSDLVESCYKVKDYAGALYLIGLLDYLAEKNDYLRITRFDRYRGGMMKSLIYAPTAEQLWSISAATLMSAIPQLLKFNFLETPDSLKVPMIM